jgi:MSHA biogenesis protein MshJ
MNERWQQLSAKFNAMTLRERVMVLASLIVVTVAIFNFLVLDPLSVRKRQLTQELGAARAGIATTENLQKLQAADPDAVKRAYRDALRKQVAEIDENMKALQKTLVPPDQMAKLLEGMLSRDRGLQLVSLHKLPARRFEAPGAPKAKADAAGTAKAAAQPERGIYQHSFELTVQGSYADLSNYLARLEKLPWQMFWGRVSVDAGHYPMIVLTLTVHTLSLDKAWLIV